MRHLQERIFLKGACSYPPVSEFPAYNWLSWGTINNSTLTMLPMTSSERSAERRNFGLRFIITRKQQKKKKDGRPLNVDFKPWVDEPPFQANTFWASVLSVVCHCQNHHLNVSIFPFFVVVNFRVIRSQLAIPLYHYFR